MLMNAEVAGVATVAQVSQADSITFADVPTMSPDKLGEQFFSKIADPCNDWYHNASKTYLDGQAAFLPQAKFMWENSLILTRYGAQAYKQTMDNMIDQIESLADAQRDLENTYAYSNKYLRYVEKNVNSGNKWRVILKWSTKISQNCLLEEEKQVDRMRQINAMEQNSVNSMK